MSTYEFTVTCESSSTIVVTHNGNQRIPGYSPTISLYCRIELSPVKIGYFSVLRTQTSAVHVVPAMAVEATTTVNVLDPLDSGFVCLLDDLDCFSKT